MTTSRVFQINISDGGVPKLPLLSVDVTVSGLAGDRQRNLKYHGGPDRAVCLYSLERLLALQADGHPVYPGATGENLTLSGVDWDQVVPGTLMRIGESLLIEITSYADPCPDLLPYFTDGANYLMDQEKYPGWSRAYARVLQPGTVNVADVVEIVEKAPAP
ncbi:MAG: MOSC domain-containing protein [Anaerolineaceae bacterium]|nr:MOSC domain-containing protein [Anaerolineaceae bacterium]